VSVDDVDTQSRFDETNAMPATTPANWEVMREEPQKALTDITSVSIENTKEPVTVIAALAALQVMALGATVLVVVMTTF